MLRSLRLRWMFLGMHAVVLVLPLLAFSFLRIYDAFLLRQTERQLAAEAVVIGEAFRDAWRREAHVEHDEHRPAARVNEHYVPVEPIYDLGVPVLPSQPEQPSARTPLDDSPEARAGAAIEDLLRRAQTFNLSAIRVLDAHGCVIATTRSERGACMNDLPEVKRALAGRYTAVARERISDEPAPPLGDVRRRGTVRMFVALPVFSNGKVIAIVRASRTGLDALSSLWANRRGLLWLGLGIGALTTLVSLLFSAAIGWPLRKLTHAAAAIAEGRAGAALAPKGFMPAEIRVLSETLESMRKKLEARASYVAEFASNASHELKTPITSIRGAAELLQHDSAGMDDAQRARFLDNIAADAARMDRLVTRLLELARLENIRPESLETSTPLPVRDFFASMLQRHGNAVQLVLHDPPESITISADHLTSVVGNLLDNALRHGRGKPVIVELGREGARLRIDVRDQGAGISEANRKRLFERFFTTERDSGGTGLGLAIVKATAEARGGRIAAESSAQGSTFTVVL
jgi:signal transduction histidine kinase